MATSHQVRCTTKDGPDWDRRIDGIGGNGTDGPWRLSTDRAIEGIKNGTWTFYTVVNGVRATVLVRRHPTSGREFLTTSPDGVRPNNLLLLPDCP